MHGLLQIMSAHVTVDSYCPIRLYSYMYLICYYFIINFAVAPPSITKQPADVTTEALRNATFTCETSGFEVKYEWKRHSSNSVLGRQSSLTISRVTPLDEGQYYCVAMTEGEYAFSNNVTLTVNGENISIMV